MTKKELLERLKDFPDHYTIALSTENSSGDSICCDCEDVVVYQDRSLDIIFISGTEK